MSAPFLQAERLTVRFGGLTAVDDVSLSVDRGEIAGLVGPNGAGKTTIFGATLDLVPLTAGRVRIAGSDATGWSAHRRARAGLGRTFQRLEVFGSMTVRENLLYASEAKAMGERPWRLLSGRRYQRPVDVDRTLDELGLTGVANTQASVLPLGILRIVEFGRSLCADPDLLLLDEPSSGLDAGETARFGEHVRRAVEERGVGVLLIEHDISLVSSLCGRLYVLDFGLLIAEGATAEVTASPKVKAAYLGSDHAVA